MELSLFKHDVNLRQNQAQASHVLCPVNPFRNDTRNQTKTRGVLLNSTLNLDLTLQSKIQYLETGRTADSEAEG